MKKLLVLILSLASLAVGATELLKATKKTHLATHFIVMETVSDSAVCSATAIAPHALLTASHCEEPTSELNVDGFDHHVLGVIRDKADHTILLTGALFDNYAAFASTPVEQGDDIFIYGNPAGRRDVLRKGYMAGIRADGVLLFDLNVFHGDSGAAILNSSGDICGVVSFIDHEKTEGEYWSLTGALPLLFTEDQLKKARAFDGK